MDFQILTEVVKAKPRKLKGKWTVETKARVEEPGEFDELDDAQLEKLRIEIFDKWNWDTGTDADRDLFDRIEKEQQRRHFSGIDPEEELVNVLSQEISDEIDKEILRSLGVTK